MIDTVKQGLDDLTGEDRAAIANVRSGCLQAHDVAERLSLAIQQAANSFTKLVVLGASDCDLIMRGIRLTSEGGQGESEWTTISMLA